MIVRRNLRALFAFTALLLVGCGGDSLPTAIETDDSFYRQGKQLQRHGRNAEALTAFLRVIEKRGDRYSPESHLEAGLLFLGHMKDPEEAIHHFRRYLELQPKAKEAPYVRGQLETARRELWKSVRGRPLEDQSQLLNLREQLEHAQRKNEQLDAEVAALRGTPAAAPFLRVTHAAIDGGTARPTTPPAPVAEPPIAPAPVPAAAPRALLPGQPTPAVAKPAGRKHTVAPGENLFRIASKYGLKSEDIAAANRDALPHVNATLRAGTELRIP